MILSITFITIALLLTAYAGRCSAAMDTVDDHWSVSIFKADPVKYPEQWFNPYLSWNNKYERYRAQWMLLASRFLPGWLFLIVSTVKAGWDPVSDYWHYEKAKNITCLIGAAALTLLVRLDHWYLSVAYFPLAGVIYNLTFKHYYNKVFLWKK